MVKINEVLCCIKFIVFYRQAEDSGLGVNHKYKPENNYIYNSYYINKLRRGDNVIINS